MFVSHFNVICNVTNPTVKYVFLLSQLSQGIEEMSMPSFLNSTVVKMLMLCTPQRTTVQQGVTISLEILFSRNILSLYERVDLTDFEYFGRQRVMRVHSSGM